MVFTLWTLLWQLLRRLGLLWHSELRDEFSNCEKSKFFGRLLRFYRRLFFGSLIERLRRFRRFAHGRNERAFVFDEIAGGTSRSAVGRAPNPPNQGAQVSPGHGSSSQRSRLNS